METATATKQPWTGFMTISETPSSMQLQTQELSPTQPPPRKKLRESCNSCALSKVKCSKDQPSCVRCEDRGIYCLYSPSRRTGKRRASPSMGGPPNTATVSLGSITPPDETVPYEWQDLGRAFTPDFPTPLGVSTFGHSLAESQVNRILSESLLPWDETLFSCGLDSPTFEYSAPPSGTGGYGAGSISDIAMQDRPSDMAASTTPQSLESANSNLSVVTPTSISTPASSCYRPKCHMAPMDDKNPGDRGQDCMTLALNILQGLHIPPSSCTFASPTGCLATDGGEPAASMAPAIDHVLSTNNAIIDSVTAILSCPCSMDAQLAMVLTLIGSKIIAWYSAVATNDDAEPGITVSPAPSGGSLATSERVLLSPVTVGKYHLDGADKCKMRAQLVLSEMHRVARLVEQLGRRFGEVGALAGDGGSFNARALSASMCTELESFLRNRMQALTKQSIDVLRRS